MARLFFALWPDAAARAALADVARNTASRYGGRAVPAANLHLTLVFLGEVDPAKIDALRRAVDGVACAGFPFVLDRIGGFRRAGVAWAGCRQSPPALFTLQSTLEARIRAAGFSPDDRAFAPHLTLARHVREPVEPEGMKAVEWRVNAFALVETACGVGAYRALAEWPLGEGKT
jgi:RNA 2',3'-cyclic 3'-phosphodiesterase